jgi:hypothetical protein
LSVLKRQAEPVSGLVEQKKGSGTGPFAAFLGIYELGAKSRHSK